MKLKELYLSLSPDQMRAVSADISQRASGRAQRIHQYIEEKLSAQDHESAFDLLQISKLVYPNHKNAIPLLRMQLSLLQNLVETSLSQVLGSRESMQQGLLLLRHYRLHKCPKNFQSLSRALLKEADEKQPGSESDLLNEHALLQEIIEFQALHFSQQMKSVFALSRRAMQRMDDFLLIHKLKNICSSINFKNIAGAEFSVFMEQPILESVMQKSFDHPLIEVYKHIYLCLVEEQEAGHFQQVRKMTEQHIRSFSLHDRKEIFSYLQNYCIKKINRGESSYNHELFELYRLALQEEVLLEEGQISARNFNNISRLAMNLHEYAWVQQFIDSYSQHLSDAERQNTIAFNLSMAHFFKGEYALVQKVLRQVNLDDELYGINYRTILAKTYYELDEEELLSYLLESFDKFVRRKRGISEEHRKNALTFIRLLRSLNHLKPYDRRAVRNLRQRIQQQTAIEKKWLNEKAAELEPGKYYS